MRSDVALCVIKDAEMSWTARFYVRVDVSRALLAVGDIPREFIFNMMVLKWRVVVAYSGDSTASAFGRARPRVTVTATATVTMTKRHGDLVSVPSHCYGRVRAHCHA